MGIQAVAALDAARKAVIAELDKEIENQRSKKKRFPGEALPAYHRGVIVGLEMAKRVVEEHVQDY